jgi:hypothetical protein
MASQRTRNASELTMAVHSVTVSAPDVGLEDLLGIIALNKGYKLPEKARVGCTNPSYRHYAAMQRRQV